MEFDNSFDVPLPPAQAWAVLMDIPRIAPCMPGAELTEIVDPQNYKGKISVRLGPVALTFAGRVEFDQIDAANRTARVKAQGSDAKGRGGANATATFRIEPAGAGSKVLHPYRSDAVGRGRAIRPRRRHDRGDRRRRSSDSSRTICARSLRRCRPCRMAFCRRRLRNCSRAAAKPISGPVAHGPRHLVEAHGSVQRGMKPSILHRRQSFGAVKAISSTSQ